MLQEPSRRAIGGASPAATRSNLAKTLRMQGQEPAQQGQVRQTRSFSRETCASKGQEHELSPISSTHPSLFLWLFHLGGS